MSFRGKEQYRKNDCRFNWRCTQENRKDLKKLAANNGKTMNEILTEAFEKYKGETNEEK